MFHCQDIIKTAEGHNNRGRVEFQDKKYEKACQQYTLALECLPEGPENDEMIIKYLCNRAECYVNMVCKQVDFQYQSWCHLSDLN